jgi:hypothetical protein
VTAAPTPPQFLAPNLCAAFAHRAPPKHNLTNTQAAPSISKSACNQHSLTRARCKLFSGLPLVPGSGDSCPNPSSISGVQPLHCLCTQVLLYHKTAEHNKPRVRKAHKQHPLTRPQFPAYNHCAASAHKCCYQTRPRNTASPNRVRKAHKQHSLTCARCRLFIGLPLVPGSGNSCPNPSSTSGTQPLLLLHTSTAEYNCPLLNTSTPASPNTAKQHSLTRACCKLLSALPLVPGSGDSCPNPS